jgi:hypothetical protein
MKVISVINEMHEKLIYHSLCITGVSALFRGMPPIMARSLPYTMVQLSTFETITRAIYQQLSLQGECVFITWGQNFGEKKRTFDLYFLKE